MAISEEEYRGYVENFCKENEGRKSVVSEDRKYTVYDSVRAILADRVSGKCIERVQNYHGCDTGYVALAKSQYAYFRTLAIPQPYLEKRAEEGYDDNYCYNNNFSFYVNDKSFGCLGLKENNGEDTTNIVRNLTYDGICAYLGLASDQNLLANRDAIADEIARNAREQMEYVEKHDGGDAQRISDIGNKYIELKCVAREVLVQAQERIDTQQNENYETKPIYDEVMQKLDDISFVTYDEVQE